jgi:hypothetical protein
MVRDLEKWLQLVKGLLGLPNQEIDPRELVLDVRSSGSIFLDRRERHSTLTLHNCLVPPSHVGGGEAEIYMKHAP